MLQTTDRIETERNGTEDEDALHTKVISATEAIKFERQVAPLEARKLRRCITGRAGLSMRAGVCSCGGSYMFMARNGSHVMGFALSDSDSL